MRFLRQNTAVIVTVGPFYDKADGVTIEGSLTITNERITLTADTDAGSAPTNILDNVTGATSGTANDLNYITGNDAGMMQLELAAADTNRVGRMFLSITDAANHVPVFHEFFVLPQTIYDWLTGVTANLSVNVDTIKTNPVVNGGTITFPSGATLASTTNITAGTITTATNVTTVNGLAANVITAAATATDFGTEISNAVWDMDATGHQTQGTFGQAIGDPAADTGTIFKAVVTDATGATVGIDVVDLKTQIGTAGAGLTAIDLPDQTMNITGSITGNLSGSVGSVTGAVGSVTGAVGSVTGNVGGTINGLTAVALKDFFDTDSATTYASAVAGSVVKEIADNAGGASLSVQDIVDGVWDEDATGHQTQGTFGQAIGDPAADTNTIFKAVVTDATGATVGADVVAVKAETVSILADTAEIGTAGAGLTAIDLPDQTMNITGNITGNLSGSVGSVSGNVGGNVTGSVGSLATQAKADVNAEVNDVINVDTKAELSGVPAANASLGDKLTFVQMKIRNEETQDGTEQTISNTSGSVIATAPTTDDGSTFTKGKYA